MSEARKDPTLDRIHLELMEETNSVVAEVPDVVRRLSLAADEMKREGRLLRAESQKARNASHPGMKRPVIAAKK